MRKVAVLGFAWCLACVGDVGPGTNDGGVDAAADSGNEAAACSAPKTSCTKGPNTVCTDTSSDDQNCGQCNSVCGSGATCVTSSCACSDPAKTYCTSGAAGACYDVKTDPNNCGKCGNKCPNTHCTAGECDRVVFLSKNTYSTNLAGPTGADTTCTSEATTAGLNGTYMAWLSSGTLGPSSRFTTKSSTPYVLADGTTEVAASFADLANGLKHAINMGPDKTTINTSMNVMTNTSSNGAGDSVSFDCAGWTSTTTDNTAYTSYYQGDATQTSAATWSTQGSTFTHCNANLIQRIYCFQQ
jgi:hypothetical protein